MSEMHLIMNGWRGYLLHEQKSQLLFEDHAYITNVLGISLPLNESGDIAPLSEELKEQILHEQMIFEGFWDDVVQKVKTGAGKLAGKFVDAVDGIKQFGEEGWGIIKQLYRVSTNPDLIGQFVGAIWKLSIRNITKQVQSTLEQLAERLPAWGMSTFAAAAAQAAKLFSNAVEAVRSLSGWKQAVASAGLAIALRWLWDKVRDFVEPYAEWMEKIKDGNNMEAFKNWLQGTIKAKFLDLLQTQFQGIVDKLTSVMTGIKPWWDAAVSAVGGVQLVIDALSGAMARFDRYTGGGGMMDFSKLNAAAT